MPNVMAARPRVAPSVQRRKVWLMPSTRIPCSNAAKTRNELKFAGVPQTRQQVSAISKFTILLSVLCCQAADDTAKAVMSKLSVSVSVNQEMWRRYCCLSSFVFQLSIHALVPKI